MVAIHLRRDSVTLFVGNAWSSSGYHMWPSVVAIVWGQVEETPIVGSSFELWLITIKQVKCAWSLSRLRKRRIDSFMDLHSESFLASVSSSLLFWIKNSPSTRNGLAGLGQFVSSEGRISCSGGTLTGLSQQISSLRVDVERSSRSDIPVPELHQVELELPRHW